MCERSGQYFFMSLIGKKLFVKHCLDVMHVKKNVSDSIIGTLLNLPGKTKDNVNCRMNLAEVRLDKQLAPKKRG